MTNQSNGIIGVLLGNGDGTFATAVKYNSGGTYPRSVTIGDLNGDGRADVIAPNSGSGNVSVLLGQADGTLATAVTYGTAGPDPVATALADFNGDDCVSGADFSLLAANYGLASPILPPPGPCTSAVGAALTGGAGALFLPEEVALADQVDDDGDDDDQADHGLLPVARDVGHDHPVLQHGEEEAADERAQD